MPIPSAPVNASPLKPILRGSDYAESAPRGKTVIPPLPETEAVILPSPAMKPPAAFTAPAVSAAPPEPAPIHIHIGT
ncbi:MAG: hypothetical protein WBM17_15505, partial [Anaerolineales bacterium]